MISYNVLCNINEIENKYHNVRLNTKHRKKILNFELFYSTNITNIYRVLLNKKYSHGNYHIFLIKEPKYRIIMSEGISDKIINHLVSDCILLPCIEPKLIDMNVATRKDKGSKQGIYYTKKYLNQLKFKHDKIYILKCDIKKYFYNIDHEILIRKLERIYSDKDIIAILKNIIETTDKEYTNYKIKSLIDKEIIRISKLNITNKDKLIEELRSIPLYKKGKGLPIGNQTSQILAIFYLSELDHFIKEKLQAKYYIRYMDDFVIFHYDKKYLNDCLAEIKNKLKELKLELNDKTKIYNANEGFNFLGYRFVLKDKKLLMLINKDTKKRITKKLNYLEKVKPANYENVLASYKGYLQNCNSSAFLERHKWFIDINEYKVLLMYKDLNIATLIYNYKLKKFTKLISLEHKDKLPFYFNKKLSFLDNINSWFKINCKSTINIKDTKYKSYQELFFNTYGLNLYNHYWFKPINNKKVYNDINYYTNEYSYEEYLKNLIKTEQVYLNYKDCLNPNNYQGINGLWSIYENNRYLITNRNILNLMLLNLLAENLSCCNCFKYKIKIIHNRTFILYKNKLDINKEYLSAYDILNHYNLKFTLYNFLKIIKSRVDIGIYNRIDDILFLYHITSNEIDLHKLGVIIDSNNNFIDFMILPSYNHKNINYYQYLSKDYIINSNIVSIINKSCKILMKNVHTLNSYEEQIQDIFYELKKKLFLYLK